MSAVCRNVRRKIAPLERDVAESHQRAACGLLSPKPLGIDLNPRERHASLHASLHFDQRELHIDRGRELRLIDLDLPQFDDFARLRAWWSSWTFRHEAIVATESSGNRGLLMTEWALTRTSVAN